MSILAEYVPTVDTSYLDDRLDAQGRIKLLPYSDWQGVPQLHIRQWCHRHARYQIPTIELVQFLKAMIGPRMPDTLEVAAGMGDLGIRLGIRMTDSAMQTTPEVRHYYHSIGQPIIDPPKDVIRISANDAVAKYKPKVVIACWLTQRWIPGRGEEAGSIHGADEEAILNSGGNPAVETYIHVGNSAVHGDKRILAREHETIVAPWLVSRASKPEGNCIYVWEHRA